MKRRLIFISILVLGLALSTLWFWPPQIGGPLFRLKVVRATQEQGKSVVFFRIEGGGFRRIRIDDAERLAGNITDGAFDASPERSLTNKHASLFWTPSQQWPIGDTAQGRREFGVLAPTKPCVWRLRVRVSYTEIATLKRLKTFPRAWKLAKSLRIPLYKARKLVQDEFIEKGHAVVESEPITNSVPESSARSL